jgi:hypothetical protein
VRYGDVMWVIIVDADQRRSEDMHNMDENVLRMFGMDDSGMLIETTIISMLDIDQVITVTRYFHRNDLNWMP